MQYKIMIAGDLHKRMKDITTIHGYTEVCRRVQLDIMQFIKDNGITHFISLGDWFDRGYGSDVSAALVHTDIDREMYNLLKGNFYGLIGNHIRIKMDSNPELFLIQPHPLYKSSHPVSRTYQIIRTPNDLVIGDTQISFLHYNWHAESAIDYRPMLDKNCSHHIALYHTEMIIPSSVLNNAGMSTTVTDSSKISNALEGIDLAIVGHIHKPIGTFSIDRLDGGETTMIVPGSLTNTDAGEVSRHDSIDIPIIELDDEKPGYSLSFVPFDLHTSQLTFMKKVADEMMREKLSSIYGNAHESLYSDIEVAGFVGNTEFMTLNSFMQKNGYTTEDKKLVKTVLNSPYDISSMVTIYNGGNELE